MEIKVAVAGCRTYTDYEEAKEFIDNCISPYKQDSTVVILSGGCRGADKIGERYADENGFRVKKFLPDWEKYGKSAGPKRNRQMAEESDFVICFWDGKSKGTRSMIVCTKECNKTLFVKNI